LKGFLFLIEIFGNHSWSDVGDNSCQLSRLKDMLFETMSEIVVLVKEKKQVPKKKRSHAVTRDTRFIAVVSKRVTAKIRCHVELLLL
jgi:hypothetical protein